MLKELTLTGASVGLIAYGALSVFVFGPEVGMRIGKADQLGFCKAHHAQWVGEMKRNAIARVPEPDHGPQKLAMARNLMNSTFMNGLKAMSRYGLRPGQANPMDQLLGFNTFNVGEQAIAQMERKAQAAQNSYNATLRRIEERAASHIAKSDEVCELAIAKAVSGHPYAWGAYAGTGGLIALEPIKNFRQYIKQALRDMNAEPRP
ncbi:MAG: hypothetical protein AAGF56_13280 [Pseudomonadota bacterium]